MKPAIWLEATSVASRDCFDIQAPPCVCADPGPLFQDVFAMSASYVSLTNTALWPSASTEDTHRWAAWASELREGGPGCD